jgi:asparagine synthase (glutamine-hydrolysing)
MAAALQHRGPDAEGVWVDPSDGLAFAHRRLSIIDLTETGSQPMHSHCGRYVITYNGECYNFPEIRKLLQAEGCVFRGSSDTEVILEAFARWGLSQMLGRLNGMFAFAIWDKQKQELVLARDRLGIKPLYYGWAGSAFWFGSELKALRALRSVETHLDLQSLGLFFRYGYIPAPHSIWAGIHKLPAAHFVVRCGVHERPKPQCYWPIASQFAHGEIPAFDGDEEEAEAELSRLLRRSVGAQMVSDVPLGAFLSGGIDSSTVVALMQDQATRPIRTFTIGFEESKFNEATFAAKIANHLGTQHSEMILSAKEAQDIVPDLGEIFDEPFADASQIPMFAVSRLARKDVTVTLSGDGGDELFAGYQHYTTGADRLERIDRLPRLVQRCVAAGLSALSEPVWDKIVNSLELVPPMRKTNLSGYKIRKYGVLCAEAEVLERYKILNSRWFAPRQIVRHWQSSRAESQNGHAPSEVNLYDRIAGFDLMQYLPEDILTKVDRAGMAVSLESRVPLLDQDVVAFALSLPLSFKRCDAGGKLLLRRVLKQFVPPALFERPKKGFSVPVSDWIRGPLRPWSEDMLSSLRRNYGTIVDCSAIDRKWTEHLSARRDWGELLWPLLMFQTWAQNQNTAVSVATQ